MLPPLNIFPTPPPIDLSLNQLKEASFLLAPFERLLFPSHTHCTTHKIKSKHTHTQKNKALRSEEHTSELQSPLISRMPSSA